MTSLRTGHSLHPQIDNQFVRLVSGNGVYVTDDAGKTYVEAHRGVLQGELTHLTFEPGAIHGHGTIAGK